MSDEYVRHLLDCAKWYHHNHFETNRLPSTFESERSVFEAMRSTLLTEAHEAMIIADTKDGREEPKQGQESRGRLAKALVYNAVDLSSSSPGIATDREGNEVKRGDGTVRQVAYEWKGEEGQDETRGAEGEHKPNQHEYKKSRMSQETAKKRAEAGLSASEARRVKSLERTEKKAELDVLSPEERKEHRKRLREEAERRREEKGRKSAAEKESEQEAKKEAHERAEGGDDERMDPTAEPEGQTPSQNEKKAQGTIERVPEESVEAVQTPQDALEPPERTKRRNTNMIDVTIHESPAPHDRHLTALTYGCLASPSLLPTLLSGVPASNPGLTLIQGPPGTGKTKRLIDELERLVEKGYRCLVCGPSNLNACDLYVRCMRRGVYGCLSLSKEHMPPGVPRRKLIELARSQVVFSTVCGRSSPALLRQPFDCVLLDEAGRCSEAHAWGLLRREVVHLAMAGDVNQLQEQVSGRGAPLYHGRSMMERLIGIGVEHESLTVQHRMHPSILRFPNDAFYGGALRTAEGKEEQEGEGGEGGADAAYVVVRVEGGKERREGTSYENEAEAEECVRQARMLADRFGEGGQGSGSRVVILTPYLAQARRLLSKRSGVEVCTVDASQGKEWDAVVLSIVRTEAEGFWSEKGRLAVALTRAKHAMRVVMSDRWFGTDGTTLLSRLSGSGLGDGDHSGGGDDGDDDEGGGDDEMVKGGAA